MRLTVQLVPLLLLIILPFLQWAGYVTSLLGILAFLILVLLVRYLSNSRSCHELSHVQEASDEVHLIHWFGYIASLWPSSSPSFLWLRHPLIFLIIYSYDKLHCFNNQF